MWIDLIILQNMRKYKKQIVLLFTMDLKKIKKNTLKGIKKLSI